VTARPGYWQALFWMILLWSAMTLPDIVDAYQGWTGLFLVMAFVVMIFVAGNRASEGECGRMLRGLVR
jgi:hypothetical protein